MVVMASASGNTVGTIARLVATSDDRVREMIHRFNDKGMTSLDPQWAGGCPRQITTDDEISRQCDKANIPPRFFLEDPKNAADHGQDAAQRKVVQRILRVCLLYTSRCV